MSLSHHLSCFSVTVTNILKRTTSKEKKIIFLIVSESSSMSSPGSVTVPGPTDSQSFTVMVACEGGSCSLQSGQEQREVLPSGKTGHTADYIPMDMPPVI